MDETKTGTCPMCEQELSTEAAARMAERTERHRPRMEAAAARMEARIARLRAEEKAAGAGG